MKNILQVDIYKMTFIFYFDKKILKNKKLDGRFIV